MKKTLLYSVLALGIISAGIGGYVYYIINVKTYDTADKKVTEITEEEYKTDLPSDKPLDEPVPPSENTSTDSDDSNSDPNSNQGPPATSTENETENETASTQPTSSNSNKHSQPKPTKVTVQQIKNNYRPVFESSQSQANGRLASLVGHAESEYSTKKANGEKIRIGYFVSKYKSAGEKLEAKTDQTFNTIYSALKNDLKRNGFDTKQATEFKTQYENEKEARKDSLYSQVKDRL